MKKYKATFYKDFSKMLFGIKITEKDLQEQVEEIEATSLSEARQKLRSKHNYTIKRIKITEVR